MQVVQMPKDAPLHRILDDARQLSWVLLRERRFASNAPDLLLAAVAIGDLEAKPLTAFKLADFIGMPRPTVIRRLAAMARSGLVERDSRRRYVLTPEGRRRAGKAAGVA
ncbi:helix-turn-helix domain-containing protein [Burkholderia cenocepacia]|uniref:helix-turn-helix domain-containing protein n=1 Tax=Burkholderia cenocepacia TaxID=95486 RepID=UPI00265643E8|nr:helix-turn-helix domain-containing protein [Burkholderia cenocepacia]MDN7545446.1 helix-turn-helix domain-containing protein [Burkholderia cenocepacia]